MRIIGCTFVLLFVLVGCMSAPKRTIKPYAQEPYVISDRVGAIIDADEREHFDLFGALMYIEFRSYRYKSATFHAALGGGYAVRIVTTKDTLVSLNNDPRGLAIMTDYIDNYEEVREARKDFEDKWDIVAYDMLNLPITRHEIELTREKLAARSRSPKRSPVLTGAALGSVIGGVTASVIAWVSTDTLGASEPEVDVLIDMVRLSHACLIGCIGGLAGGTIGGLVGYSVRGAGEVHWYNAEDAAIIDIIKKQRNSGILED